MVKVLVAAPRSGSGGGAGGAAPGSASPSGASAGTEQGRVPPATLVLTRDVEPVPVEHQSAREAAAPSAEPEPQPAGDSGEENP